MPTRDNICRAANIAFTGAAGEDVSVALSVSTRTTDGCTVVAVSGDVDISTSPVLRSALAAVTGNGARAIVVDLTGVPFLDSTALGVLVGAYTTVRNEGGRFAIVTDHGAVLKVLRITALHDVLGVHPTLAEALTTVTQPVPATD
jgi:anti-sigma B factor antagonist